MLLRHANFVNHIFNGHQAMRACYTLSKSPNNNIKRSVAAGDVKLLAQMAHAPAKFNVTDRAVLDLLVRCAWLAYEEGCVIQSVLTAACDQLPGVPTQIRTLSFFSMVYSRKGTPSFLDQAHMRRLRRYVTCKSADKSSCKAFLHSPPSIQTLSQLT